MTTIFMVHPPLSINARAQRGACTTQTREEENTGGVPAEHAARRAAHDVEHVERNTNADVAYLFRPPR
jgi:hypothetical protein